MAYLYCARELSAIVFAGRSMGRTLSSELVTVKLSHNNLESFHAMWHVDDRVLLICSHETDVHLAARQTGATAAAFIAGQGGN